MHCKEDVLGKRVFTSIGGVPIVVFIPNATLEQDPDNLFDCLVPPNNFPHFKIEWGHVYRRPNIIAGVRTVGVVVSSVDDPKYKLYASIAGWKTKFENIIQLMMKNLILDQESIRIDQIAGGGINFHTGLRLFDINKKLNEIRNPYNAPPIRVNLMSEATCLDYKQLSQAFYFASSIIPISHTYTLLLISYNAFTKGDFRSAVILGGSAVENSILQKLIRYSKEHGTVLKTPIGELSRKFDRLKQLSINIPINNYKSDLLNIRNSVVHKGMDVSEKETLDYLEKCRIIIDEYEPSIIGNDITFTGK